MMLLRMEWRDCCFAHWRADPERVARALPPGVQLDEFAGEAWLSVVPFRLQRVRARALTLLPGFDDVAEINLRTYVRVGGRPGIWFFSLDAADRLLVESARVTTSLPYFRARIDQHETANGIRYRSERIDARGGHGGFSAAYTIPRDERPAEPDSRAAFLHDRYRFFARRGNRLVTGVIAHRPWTLGAIAPDIEENTLGEIIAHPLTGPPDLAFFSRSLRVNASLVEPVRAT